MRTLFTLLLLVSLKSCASESSTLQSKEVSQNTTAYKVIDNLTWLPDGSNYHYAHFPYANLLYAMPKSFGVAWSSTEKFIAAVNNGIRVYDVTEEGGGYGWFENKKKINTLVSAEGIVAFGDEEGATVIDSKCSLDSKRELIFRPKEIMRTECASISKDAHLIAFGGYIDCQRSAAIIYDLRQNSPVAVYPTGDVASQIVIDSDNKSIAIGSKNTLMYGSIGSNMRSVQMNEGIEALTNTSVGFYYGLSGKLFKNIDFGDNKQMGAIHHYLEKREDEKEIYDLAHHAGTLYVVSRSGNRDSMITRLPFSVAAKEDHDIVPHLSVYRCAVNSKGDLALVGNRIVVLKNDR